MTAIVFRKISEYYMVISLKDYLELELDNKPIQLIRNYPAIKFRRRKSLGGDGVVQIKYIHRLILKEPKDLDVDHKDRNTLNCMSDNLRKCTKRQNKQNRSIETRGTSKYKGVNWDARSNKWKAMIGVNDSYIYLGLYNAEIDAAKAYNIAAVQYYGEFAVLNELVDRRVPLEQIWMDLTKSISERSTCIRAKVGAVVTDLSLQSVLSVGYNGTGKNMTNNCDSLEPGKCQCVHAEVNALIKAGTKEEKVMFLNSSPCPVCSKLMLNANVKKVYFNNFYRDISGLANLLKANMECYFMQQKLDGTYNILRINGEISMLMKGIIIGGK